MTIWLLLVIITTIYQENTQSSSLLTPLVFSLTLIVLTFFSLNNLIYFYIFFELSIIPIFLIILIWGYQSERLFARLNLLLYTFIASLPLLFVLLFLRQQLRTTRINLITTTLITRNNTHLLTSVRLCFAFLVKTPIYLTHMWLPKAHVEAPVFGSMILASILLKIGTFGFLLLSMASLNNTFHLLLLSLRLWAAALVSVLCIKAMDIKVLVAYSSVSHIAFLISLILINTQLRIRSRVLMILTHGFTSSALFFTVNLIYEISNSRNIVFNKGVLFTTTYFFIWARVLIRNISAPPTINFIAEVLGVFAIINIRLVNFWLIFLFIVCTATYSYFMFSITAQIKTEAPASQIILKKNYVIILRHLIPIFFLIFNLANFT